MESRREQQLVPPAMLPAVCAWEDGHEGKGASRRLVIIPSRPSGSLCFRFKVILQGDIK